MIVDSGYFQEMSLRVVSLRLARSLSALKANSPSSEDRSSACMEYCKLLKLQDEPVLARGRLHMVLACPSTIHKGTKVWTSTCPKIYGHHLPGTFLLWLFKGFVRRYQVVELMTNLPQQKIKMHGCRLQSARVCTTFFLRQFASVRAFPQSCIEKLAKSG